jgi:Domain of unknown function (DUF4234)
MTHAITASTTTIGKSRSSKAIVGLNLITLGLYSIYWWFEINRELRDLGETYEAPELRNRPALSAVAFGLGGCLLVPYVWTAVTTSRRIRSARRVVGITSPMYVWGIVGLLGTAALTGFTGGGSTAAAVAAIAVAWVLKITAMAHMQSLLNDVWRISTRSAVPTSSAPVDRPAVHAAGVKSNTQGA